MKRFLLGACVAAGLLVSADGGASSDQEKNPAEGLWQVVAMERNGVKLADEVVKKLDMKLTVMGQRYTVTAKGKVVDKGTSKIDGTKTPNTVDSTSEEDPGKIVLGIRQVEGDSMKACYDLEGKKRPTAFATTQGSGHVLLLYRRLR
jgi:uncharacterized protein (TIGR03067 family)